MKQLKIAMLVLGVGKFEQMPTNYLFTRSVQNFTVSIVHQPVATLFIALHYGNRSFVTGKYCADAFTFFLYLVRLMICFHVNYSVASQSDVAGQDAAIMSSLLTFSLLAR